MSAHQRWNYSTSRQENLLVTFTDWQNFIAFSKNRSSSEMFSALNDFYALSDKHVSSHSGLPIKYIGDAGLAVFSEQDADEGIMCMFDFKKKIDKWFKENGFHCSLYVNCHFGEVTIGPMGAKGFEKIDVIGQTVNVCATLAKRGFSMSPQAFRCLSKENRKFFKKFTPPITYHPVAEY